MTQIISLVRRVVFGIYWDNAEYSSVLFEVKKKVAATLAEVRNDGLGVSYK